MVKTRQAGTEVTQALVERQTSLISSSSLSFAPAEGVCYCLVAKLCRTLATPWTVARQAPLSVGFIRQEYWSGLPSPSPEIFPTQGFNWHLLLGKQILYQ